MDKGHKVYQISDALKAEVSEELQQQARELNRQEFTKRLNEIGLAESEYEFYQTYKTQVNREIEQLKDVLNSVRVRSGERQWLKNQSHGELDESRIVDGVTGDRLIYKRRGSTIDDGRPFKSTIFSYQATMS